LKKVKGISATGSEEMATAVEIVSKDLELSPRVQRGLKLAQEGRFQKKQLWEGGLFSTVLDEETARLPLVKRKALAVKKVLSEMPVKVMEHELVVGFPPQKLLMAGGAFPEYATQDEKEAARKMYCGTASIFAHFTPSYARYLRLGLVGLHRIAEDKLDEVRRKGTEPEKEAWYESVIISLDGLKILIQRYRDTASELADSETDRTRKGELQELAGISQNLMNGPPKTFREALQAFHFAYIAFCSTMNMPPLGRFDQYLWPYLKRDLESGAITLDKAQDLIDDSFLRFNELLQTYNLLDDSPYAAVAGEGLTEARATSIGSWSSFMGGKTSQERVFEGVGTYTLPNRMDVWGGVYSLWMANMALAGLTPEGEDGTNPLTYLCINAKYRLKMPQPNLYVRFHDGSPPELYERVADCIRAGLSGPSIYCDEVIVPSQEKAGIPLEHARDYTCDGCWEVHVQGRTQFKYSLHSAPEWLDRVLCPERWWDEPENLPLYVEAMDPYRDSKPPDPYRLSSFNEVMESFREQLDLGIKGFIEVADSMWDGRLSSIAPLPLFSAFTEGPLESGKDITQGGIQYVVHAPFLTGLSHAADSLAAIKKLCFEEKVIEWRELLDAVRNNWEGKEPLRQLVRTRAPAYGTDVDYVDDIAREIVECYVESLRKHGSKAKSKTRFHGCVGTFEWYIGMGSVVGATPDGRLAGEPFGANAGPSMGRGVTGPTAVMNSFLKLPLIDLPTGSCLDVAMSPRSDLLVEPFIKSFIERRGSVLNISVNDVEQLRAAMKEPDKYRDLKIRVGGWEAFFVDLPPEMQKWQVQKFEQYGT
jgi:formate C-acetyltransferase